MKHVSSKKYRTWHVDRISLGLKLMHLHLSRRPVPVTDDGEISNGNNAAKLMFSGIEKINFKNFAPEKQITSIDQTSGAGDAQLYSIECGPNSRIEITAREWAEIRL